MSNVTRMPDRSPKVSSKIVRGEEAPKPRGAANQNVSRAARNAALNKKYPSGPGRPINSGSFAYGKKAPTSSLGQMAKGVAGGIARGVGRIAGPAGALIGMTQPAGEGSDRPSGPLMGGTKSRGPGGGPLSAPARTEPSRSDSRGPIGPSGPNSGPSRSGGSSDSRGPGGPSGPNSGPSRSGGASNSGGPGGPSGPNSGPSQSGGSSGSSRSSGPGGPSGPNSSPSSSSSAPRGSERFAKGSLVMAKSAKNSYFSKDAVKRSRASFSKPSRNKGK